MTRPAFARLWPAVALVSLASAWTPPTVSAQDPSRRTVLAIHWRSEDFATAPEMNESIHKALRSDPNIQIDFFVEYLESDVFPEDAVSQALADYIRQKYRDRPIDVVIALADPALRFVLDRRDDLFPNVPIVYSGLAVPDNSGGVARGLTAVLRGTAYAETLKLALALHPSTEQVFVVAGRPDGQVVNAVKAEFRDFSQSMRLTFLDEMTLPRLMEAVRAVPPRSLILYIFFSDVSDPARYDDEEIARLVASSAPVPVYGTNERYVGTGVVGGVVRVTSETGIRVGELALAILHGARPEDLPIEHARLVPTFDWRQVRRWGLDESRLPAASTVQFRAPTAWEAYKAYIIGTIIVVLAQALLIAGLIAQRVRRRRAEAALEAREATLRTSYERSRLLAGKLINAEEATRADIARDLHDGVCQDLIGVSMAVASLKRSTGQIQDPQAQRALSLVHEETRGVCEKLRRLSHDLHPTTLQLLGLASALKAHCTEVEQHHRVQVPFTASGDFGDIRPDVVVCVFRIAQESLRNAVVHGHAKRLAVSLTRSGDHIELAVTDNGRGFDVEAVRRTSSGLGLVSMEERARGIGAEMYIVSGVGPGTTIRVRGPAESRKTEATTGGNIPTLVLAPPTTSSRATDESVAEIVLGDSPSA